MKQRILIILWLLAVAFATQAQTTHRVGITIDGGYALLPKVELSNAGYDAALGVVYELQHKHFLFDATLMAQYEYGKMTNGENYSTLTDLVDSDGDRYTLIRRYSSNKGSFRGVAPAVSISAGAAFSGFWFLAGARVSYDVYNTMTASSLITTSAKYAFFDEELTNVENLGYRHIEDYNMTLKDQVHLPATYLVAQAGWQKHVSTITYRVGARITWQTYYPYENRLSEYVSGSEVSGSAVSGSAVSASAQRADLSISSRLSAGITFSLFFDAATTRYSSRKYKCRCEQE